MPPIRSFCPRPPRHSPPTTWCHVTPWGSSIQKGLLSRVGPCWPLTRAFCTTAPFFMPTCVPKPRRRPHSLADERMGHGVPRRRPAPESWLTKEDSGDPPLGIHGETFIEPEFTPVGISDQVPEPTVGDLVDDDVGQGAVPCQQAGGDKGQTRVLHSSKWKGWWHEEQVIPAKRTGGHRQVSAPQGRDPASLPQAAPSALRDTATEEVAPNPGPSAEMTPSLLYPPARSLGPPFRQVLLSRRWLSESCSLFSCQAGYGRIISSVTVSSLTARLGSPRSNRAFDPRRLTWECVAASSNQER